MADIKEGIQQQKDFIETWPVERVKSMTLEEYNNLNRSDSFCYWLEKKAEASGSIWGGSAFKFGIYRANPQNWTESTQYASDEDYAWYSKYGDTAEAAYLKVHGYILQTIEASQKDEFDKIDQIDLGNSYKWKIAFHYNTEKLIPIFNREILTRVGEAFGMTDSRKKETSELQGYIFSKKKNADSTLDFAHQLWIRYGLDIFFYVVEKFLKQSQTSELKRRGFPKNYRGFGVRVSFGAGTSSKIPWVALFTPPNTVSKGIYPVYLYFKEENILILAYGVSETEEPQEGWPNEAELTSIRTWFEENLNSVPFRYGSSFIKESYNLKNELDPEKIQNDLDEVLEEYGAIEFPQAMEAEEPEAEYSTRRYWIYAPGEGASKWIDFFKEGVAGVDWDVGDLTKFDNRDSVREALISLYPEGSVTQTNNSLALWEFANVMNVGDIIVAKRGLTEYIGYGIVSSDYYYDSSREEFSHLRKVEWKKEGTWQEEVHQIVGKTLTDITKYPEYVDRLRRLIGIEQAEAIPKTLNYWWLNANPKYWKITDFEVGQEQAYTTHNEKGNKRSRFEYFQQAGPGDLILGYASSPIKQVVAVFEVTRSAYINEDDGEEEIAFVIQKFLPDPIKWGQIYKMPEMKESEILNNRQGSLFKLTKEEFQAITNPNLLREINIEEYTKEDALKGLFLEEIDLDNIQTSLEYKKNIILQGPPGTGKTFMAKRLAYTLMGEKDPSKIEMIQFHQSYSYEDFIQGYRPKDDGTFRLENGVFYRFCKRAQADPDKKYFFVIDEINRGNLSKIFGELMLLIEADKRDPKFGVSLTYSQGQENRFYIPDNVYLIGTMNTADRSLAIVDYALRRRFAFINVMPTFNKKFKNELVDNGVDEGIVDLIQLKIEALNAEINKDPNLGRGFQIGHSYFCNVPEGTGDEDWYQRIIHNEIAPMLREYWFDDEEKAEFAINRLLS